MLGVTRVLFLWLMFMSDALAYVDPGSGMLIWQGVVAVIGAILVFLRNPLSVVKNLIKRLRGK